MPRLEHRCFGQHLTVCLCDGFAHRARRVTHFQSDVPEQIENPLNRLLERLREFFAEIGVEKHHIQVAPRI